MADLQEGKSRRVSTYVALQMPRDFPVTLYDYIISDLPKWRVKYPATGIGWRDDWASHLAAGWQGVAFRFRDCTEYDVKYRKSIKRVGPAPEDQRQRYLQDSAFFGFFVAGQAVLENFHYGIYALCAGLDDTQFAAIKNGKSWTIKTKLVAQSMQRCYPLEPLTLAVGALYSQENDPTTTWGQWRRARNMLSHVMAPGLHVHLQWGGAGSRRTVSSWAENIELDDNTTATRRAWLATTLLNLLSTLYEFVQHHL